MTSFLQELPEERRPEALRTAVRIGVQALRQTSTVVNVDYVQKEMLRASQEVTRGLEHFGSGDHVPAQIGVLRELPGSRYVCVLEREAPDDAYLQGAYRFIRMHLLHSLRNAPVTADLSALVDLIRAARERLSLIAQVKRQLSTSGKGLEAAAETVDQLRNELIEDFKQMDRLVKREAGEEGTVA